MLHATNSTTTDRTKSFDDRMCELTTGIDLLIAHIDKVFDAGFELPMKEGADVMDACMAAQWIAAPQRGHFHGGARVRSGRLPA